MHKLFGIAIIAACVFTAWAIEPTIGKAAYNVSLDPHGMMLNTTNLPQAHYDDYSTVF